MSFGDRPQKLINLFKKLDSQGTGKVELKVVMQLLTTMDVRLTPEEAKEFETEANAGGYVEYEKFVREVIFDPSLA